MQIFGVDIGGTFTDVILYDEATGKIVENKVSSTPPNFAHGFERGLRSVGVDLRQVTRALHGTTVCTNAAIERKGASTAGVFTKGFRDVVEIGTGQRFVGGLFDTKFEKTAPLIPRYLRLEVDERTSYQGDSVRFPQENELRSIVSAIKEQQARAVAVCFLNSYQNPAHERLTVEFLRRNLPDHYICSSEEVLPLAGEYHRFTTATFNAYLGPTANEYIGQLHTWLEQNGLKDELLIMASSGGVISAELTKRHPVSTLLSGPAAGVSGCVWLSAQLGIDNLISYDMGGTSTDTCLIKNKLPSLAMERIVGGLPLKLPQLEINTIGAGGGSIAWVDRQGTFGVGPHSAGALPGPVCYGHGGREPTVTDANLVLGRMGGETQLAGFMRLDLHAAREAVNVLAERLGHLDVYAMAEGIVRVCESNMAGAIRAVSVERGEDPREFALVAFGGAGPMHGCSVAQEVGMRRVVVPKHPGAFSALGLLTSDLKHEFVRTYIAPLGGADLSAVARIMDEIAEEAFSLLASEGVSRDAVRLVHFLSMRYVGQSRELRVEVAPDSLNKELLAHTFHRRYYEEWSYNPPTREVELAGLRVLAIGQVPKLVLPHLDGRRRSLEEAFRETRAVHFGGKALDTPVYERALLPVEAILGGPAIVDELGATTVIPPEWEARVDDTGNLLIEAR